jgi:hypothetical protein
VGRGGRAVKMMKIFVRNVIADWDEIAGPHNLALTPRRRRGAFGFCAI